MATKKHFSFSDHFQLRMVRIYIYGRTSGSVIQPYRNNIWLYTTLFVTKGIPLLLSLEAFPSNVSFRRDVVRPRLHAWNALLQLWLKFNCRKGLMNFNGTYMKMVSSRSTPCIKS
jgi:hypothetical protein